MPAIERKLHIIYQALLPSNIGYGAGGAVGVIIEP